MFKGVSINNGRWHTPIKLLVLFAIGSLSALSMAPANFWPAIFFGLSSLYIMVTRAPTPIKAGAFAFAFALGYFGFSLYWIGNALLVDDNPYWWAWPFAISGLPLILSIFPAIAATAYKRFAQRLIKQENTIANYLLFCILLALADYARGNLFTGFPWNLYACTWIDILPVAQLAAFADIYLLNTATIFWAVTPAFILSSSASQLRKYLYLTLIVATFVLSYTYGLNRINAYFASASNESSNLQIVIVQPNIKQSEKWKLEKRAQNFIDLVDMSHYQNENDLDTEKTIILWPETAISQDILNTEWTMDMLRDVLSSYPRDVILMTGALRYYPSNYIPKKPELFYNSILTFNKNGDIVDTYDKQHLVPFGEYIPLDSYIKISPVVGFTGFIRGSETNLRSIPMQPKDAVEGQGNVIKYIGLICYEAIFPKYVRLATSKKPELIVNVTNDAWYGNSAGPYQHLVQARFRAIESGLPLIRSANTGISAVIGPVGNIVSSIDLMKKDILIEKLPQAID